MVRKNLLNRLLSVLDDEQDWLVIHSSLAKLAPEEPLNKWDFLYAVRELTNLNIKLAFPAFTFSFCGGKQFSTTDSKSETGVLADWVLECLPDSYRTDHPIYSFVVIGDSANQLGKYDSITTWGDTSPFAFFEKVDARICMLGADWSSCTQFHRYEEMAQVPYRLFKTFRGDKLVDGVSVNTQAQMFVRDLELDPENNFDPLISAIRKSVSYKESIFARGCISSVRIEEIKHIANDQLEADELIYIENKNSTSTKLKNRKTRENSKPFKIALLGSSNLDALKVNFQEQIDYYIPDRIVELYTTPFNQVGYEIYDSNSQLRLFDADLTFFVDRLEDLVGVSSLEIVENDKIIEAAVEYGNLIFEHHKINNNLIVIQNFALSDTLSIVSQQNMRGIIDQCNDIIAQKLSGIKSKVCLEMPTIFDPRTWYIGRFPYSDGFTKILIKRWIKIVLATLEKTVRLVILDLDNTLWGGVVGEDGLDFIAVGGDFPGNCYKDFQASLKLLSQSGIALAISSKNDEEIALDVFKKHSDMVLGLDDFVSHRINWLPKHENIRQIVSDLSLGLESVLFIDDNPIERESVRKNLPGIKILDLPQDPALYSQALIECPWIEVLNLSNEDKNRVAFYKNKSKIDQVLKSAINIDDYLMSLEIEVFIQKLSSDNIQRAAQLCLKTNQFNTTTKRYNANDLSDLSDSGNDVIVIGYKDKLSIKENIGLVILKEEEQMGGGKIDLFLLSCRILGRGVEKAVIEWCASRAKNRGWGHLSGEILVTERNTPIRELYIKNGFTKNGQNNFWTRKNLEPNAPNFITLVDSLPG